MCGDAHVCGDRKTALGVIPGNVGNSPETGLFLNWCLPVEIDWLASKAQGNSCLCLPSAGIIISVCQPSCPLFNVASWDRTQFLVLTGRVVYQLIKPQALIHLKKQTEPNLALPMWRRANRRLRTFK